MAIADGLAIEMRARISRVGCVQLHPSLRQSAALDRAVPHAKKRSPIGHGQEQEGVGIENEVSATRCSVSEPGAGASHSGLGIVISDYPDVYARAVVLGLNPPGTLSILPRGFASGSSGDLCHEAETATLGKVWSAAGVRANQVQPPEGKLPSVVQRSADWIAPTIFVGGMLFSQNPIALQLAMEVLGSYVVDALNSPW